MLHAVPSHSPFRALVDWYHRQRLVQEFSALDRGEAARIADDLKISVDDLVTAASQSDDEIALMDRMMALHGLNAEAVKASQPGVVRDMAVTCAKCTCKGECRYDLDHGVTAAEADVYCPNSDTMTALAHAKA